MRARSPDQLLPLRHYPPVLIAADGSREEIQRGWLNAWTNMNSLQRLFCVLVIILVLMTSAYFLLYHSQSTSVHLVLLGNCLSQPEHPEGVDFKAPEYHVPFTAASFWAQVENFDTMFRILWDQKGYLLKYAFQQERVKTKKLKGSSPLTFVLQYVEGRKKKPPGFQTLSQTPPSAVSDGEPAKSRAYNVTLPFDPERFNFNKADQREIIFHLVRYSEDSLQRSVQGKLPVLDCERIALSDEEERSLKERRMASVFVNVYPYAYGCIAIAVRPTDNLPQVLSEDALRIGLSFASQSPTLRVGFNSLEAGASVNHLHFQAFYTSAAPGHALPAERVETQALHYVQQVQIGELKDYPVRALSFTVVGRDQHSFDFYISTISKCVNYLLAQNIPHNLVIANSGKRVILFPRHIQPHTGLGDRHRLGFPELSGQPILVDLDVWERPYTHQDFWNILSKVTLTKNEFLSLKRNCLPLH